MEVLKTSEELTPYHGRIGNVEADVCLMLFGKARICLLSAESKYVYQDGW